MTMRVNHAERFPNTFKWFILEKVNRDQKEALRGAIGGQLQTIDHLFPAGVPLTFFGDDQHGFVSLEYIPLSETADPHIAGIHFGIYPRSLTPEEREQVQGSQARCLSLPYETIMRLSLSGTVSANFDVDRYPDVSKYGVPYGGMHVVPSPGRTKRIAFLPSPLSKVSTNYLEGVHHNLSIVMRRIGIGETPGRRFH